VARAIVRDRFDSRRSASVLSQMTQVMIVAPLLAPTLGGYLLVHMGWPAIFVTLGASGLLMSLVCWRYLPETARLTGADGVEVKRQGTRAGVLVPMMAYMFGQGLLMPYATAAAMAPHGESAGVVSSLMGALQTAGGALAG